MILLGSIVNIIAIVLGVIFGLFFNRIEEKYKETVTFGIGLVVILIGMQMALQSDVVIVVLISILTGAMIGEFFSIESRLNSFANKASLLVYKGENASKAAEAFISATLIFTVGAMAIIGALNSGLQLDHGLLFTKSILDGFTSLVLTSTLGIGVVFSIIPVFIYQGTITIFASSITAMIPEVMFDGLLNEFTATGGLLIVAIGLNLLKVTKIRIANLLPSLIIVVIIYIIYYNL